jgi:hypothetical protein
MSRHGLGRILPFLAGAALFFASGDAAWAQFSTGTSEDPCQICWQDNYAFCRKEYDPTGYLLDYQCIQTQYDASRYPIPENPGGTVSIYKEVAPGQCFESFCCPPEATKSCIGSPDVALQKFYAAFKSGTSIGPVPPRSLLSKLAHFFLPLDLLNQDCASSIETVRDKCRGEKFIGLMSFAATIDVPGMKGGMQASEGVARAIAIRAEHLMQACKFDSCAGAAFQAALQAAKLDVNYVIQSGHGVKEFVYNGKLYTEDFFHSWVQLFDKAGNSLGYLNKGKVVSSLEELAAIEEVKSWEILFEGDIAEYVIRQADKGFVIPSPASAKHCIGGVIC